MAYLTLFFVAFGAATLLPGGSEALYLYDLQAGFTPWAVWSVATAGNTLGSVVNYYLGSEGEAFLERRGYADAEKIASAKRKFDRYGGWALMLSWMPVIGDPLTFVAGALRYRFARFLMIVAAAKGIRYAVIGFLWQSV
jgi:membrane protein YqaA with SNARE-associated domain